MDRELVVENINEIMQQVKSIALERKYGLGVNYIYYAGGTLCTDILDKKTNKIFVVMVNISGEKFLVSKDNGEFKTYLLPIKALKLAFEIYAICKGKTEYYQNAFDKSCLRHLNC